MSGRVIVRGAALGVAASALLLGVPALASAAPQAAPQARANVADTAPAWMNHAKKVGKTSNSAAANVRVYLQPKGGVAAEQAAVTAVSTPGSKSYRHFLSPNQFEAQYEPTKAEVNSVSSWLNSQGLKVTGVSANNTYVSATGTVAAAQTAFGTQVQTYTHDGQTVQAPSGALSVPLSVAGQVLTVTGLDTTRRVNTTDNTITPPAPAPAAGFYNAHPCSIYYGQIAATYQQDYKTKLPKFEKTTPSYAPCGYTGPQLRAAYEGNTNLTGKGVTVATDLWFASPTIASDVATYAANHGDGGYAKNQFTQANFPKFNYDPACDPGGTYSEEALDIEAVHAMAPDANIRYYAAKDCYDNNLLDSLSKIVTENKAQVVSSSWGGAESGESAGSVAAYEQVFMQGALQGISFMFSSGDSGDELAATGLKQSDYPTSDPYVTSVGGTATAIGPNGEIDWQTGWGTDKYTLSASNTWTAAGYLYGAGGGFSALNNRPSYQDGVVPASAPPGRAVPDVSMDADPTTGMLIGLTQTFPDGTHYGEYRIGGTSLASPLFAGMTALLVQNAGGSLGLLNPTIYGQAGSGAGTFNDVTGPAPTPGAVRIDYANSTSPADGYLYSVRTFDQDATLTTTPGWDDVTGVGTPGPGYLTSVKPAASSKK